MHIYTIVILTIKREGTCKIYLPRNESECINIRRGWHYEKSQKSVLEERP